MKQIITNILCIVFPMFSFAQLTVGSSSTDNASTILQIGDLGTNAENNKGFILPSVITQTDIISTKEDNFGTIIFDLEDQKIKYLKASNSWEELSKEGNHSRVLEAFNHTTYTDIATFAQNQENNESQGIVLGSETSEAEGSLILESDDKGFVLPYIADPHMTVPM